MEFILIAWFSMVDSDAVIGREVPFSLATSITQEFNSQEACESAGQALQKNRRQNHLPTKIWQTSARMELGLYQKG